MEIAPRSALSGPATRSAPQSTDDAAFGKGNRADGSGPRVRNVAETGVPRRARFRAPGLGGGRFARTCMDGRSTGAAAGSRLTRRAAVARGAPKHSGVWRCGTEIGRDEPATGTRLRTSDVLVTRGTRLIEQSGTRGKATRKRERSPRPEVVRRVLVTQCLDEQHEGSGEEEPVDLHADE